MATGVLAVCLGQATKLAPFLQEGDKVYEGRILLGRRTDTEDVTGRTLEEQPVNPLDPADVAAAAQTLTGWIDQTAPAFSAVKIDGRPSYERARRGLEVPVRVRRVMVHELEITAVNIPLVSFRTRVSKGTYVRTMAVDLGKKLGLAACLEQLRRLKTGPFDLDQALSLDEIGPLAEAGLLAPRIVNLEQAVAFLPRVEVSEDQARGVAHGRPLSVQDLALESLIPGPVGIHRTGRGLLAIYECHPPANPASEWLTPLRVLGGE
jgi:tRNA pseudouridine55 synthase